MERMYDTAEQYVISELLRERSTHTVLIAQIKNLEDTISEMGKFASAIRKITTVKTDSVGTKYLSFDIQWEKYDKEVFDFLYNYMGFNLEESLDGEHEA